MSVKKSIINFIDEHNDEFCNVSLDIWENPELGLQEYYASDKLVKLLERKGFAVENNVAGMPTAFVATFGTGKPVIGFSAEFDALPGLSQKNTSNEKEPITLMAPGHGCGHNLLATGGIQAAVALKDVMEREDLKGTLKVFGTPAEEICIGKPFMARAGLFKGLDAVVDWHSGFHNSCKYCRNNAYFNIKFHFSGKASHGNAPWRGISALDSAMLMGHALEIMREHIPPGDKDAESTLNYAFPDCGNAYPVVVPDKSIVWIVGRFGDAELCMDVLERVRNAAEGCAKATGATVKEEFITATHNKIPNTVMAETIYDNFKQVGPPPMDEEDQRNVKEIQSNLGFEPTGYGNVIKKPEAGFVPVTDSSEYSWHAPLGMFEAQLVPQPEMMGHNWMMVRLAGSQIGMKVMTTASKVLALTAYDLLTNPELLKQAKDEFNAKMDGREYTSLLPNDCEPDLDTNKDLMEKFRKK